MQHRHTRAISRRSSEHRRVSAIYIALRCMRDGDLPQVVMRLLTCTKMAALVKPSWITEQSSWTLQNFTSIEGIVASNMALLLQRLFRSQQLPQQLLNLQGGCALSGLREFSAAAPEKARNRGLGSSRAEGTAPRFYKYVGVEPAPGQVCAIPRLCGPDPVVAVSRCQVACRRQAGKLHSMTGLSKLQLGNRLLSRRIPLHLLLLQNGSGRYTRIEHKVAPGNLASSDCSVTTPISLEVFRHLRCICFSKTVSSFRTIEFVLSQCPLCL